MTRKKTHGYRVLLCRRAAGLTQQQLADQAGTSLKTIQKIEGEVCRASLALLSGLADALGVPVDRLMPTGCHSFTDYELRVGLPSELGAATDAAIRQAVASAPPLTPERAARISSALWPKGVSQ